MKKYISKGIICIKDKYNIEYHLCIITYVLNEDETFEYCFKPNYSVIDLIDKSVFDTVPGLDLGLRKKEYVRKNIVPTFVSERVIGENREDYTQLLEERNMKYMDPIIYMIRSKKEYSGDKLFVKEYEDVKTVNMNINDNILNMHESIKEVLTEICKGNNIILRDAFIDDNNRKETFDLLYYFYSKSMKYRKEKQAEGIAKAKAKNMYKGRKPIKIEKFKVQEMSHRVKNKELTSKEAAKQLGISIDKYYRVLRSIQT